MKTRTIAFVTGALFCMLSAPAVPQSSKDWVDIKDPRELRAIYSNKTFKGKDIMGRSFVEHFREDGNGIRIMEDQTRIPRSWTVKGGNQVCISFPWEVPCYRMQRHRSTAGQYRLINLGNDQVTAVTVEDGVPKF